MKYRNSDRDNFERWQRYGHERGWMDRAKDEVGSWFGDEEASRRRQYDEQGYRGTQDYRSGQDNRGGQEFRSGQDYGWDRDYSGREDWQMQNRRPMGSNYGQNQGYGQSTGYGQSSAFGQNQGYGQSSVGQGFEGRENNDLYGEYSRGMGSMYGSRQGQMGQRGKRGPKNFQRNDERLSDDLHEKLDRHPEIDAREIEIEVHNGEVTLKGTVNNRRDKRLAEDICEDCFGVKNVHNMIRVNTENEDERTQHDNSRTSGRQLTTAGKR